MPIQRPTLWQRVQGLLENRPSVVVVMLLVIGVSGLKDALEGYDAVGKFYEKHFAGSSAEARTLPCSRIEHEVSEPAAPSEKSTLTFINSLVGTDVRIAWIDEGGHSEFFPPTLPAGTETAFETYRSHVWVIRDAANHCLGLVRAGLAPAVVTAKGSALYIRKDPAQRASSEPQ